MRFNSFSAAIVLTLTASALAACAPAPAAASDYVVEIRGLEFVPAEIDASPGDTITWVNKDVMPHTATSDSGDWDSGSIDAGDEWSLTVEEGSGGGYSCTFHPGMSGAVSVD